MKHEEEDRLNRKKNGRNRSSYRSEAYRRINDRVHVLSRAESQHNVIVDIRPEGMTGGDCHVYSKVPGPSAPQVVTIKSPSRRKLLSESVVIHWQIWEGTGGEGTRGGAGGEGRVGKKDRGGRGGKARSGRGGERRGGEGRGGQGRAGKTYPLMSTGRMSCCTRVLFLMLATASDSGVTACIATSSHLKTKQARACCKEIQNTDYRAHWKEQHR